MPNITDTIETDVLVLGAGAAGLRAALAASAPEIRVTVLHTGSGASPFILAFNAFTGGDDAPETYREDMLRGGGELNDAPLVTALVAESGPLVEELTAWGLPFAQQGQVFARRLLGGNSRPRSVYAPGGTGLVALRLMADLARDRGVSLHSGTRVTALLQHGNQVVGALAWTSRGGLIAARARAVVLALGGAGRVYASSTYPADVSGTGYALAYECGATLVDMEFVQFEPTVVTPPLLCAGMTMPTAMLGDGAVLLNSLGERFMLRYAGERGERGAEKAFLAGCIQREVAEGRGVGGAVLFDARPLPPQVLEGYPNKVRRLRAAGVEPSLEPVPVFPAAHSHMGGCISTGRASPGCPASSPPAR